LYSIITVVCELHRLGYSVAVIGYCARKIWLFVTWLLRCTHCNLQNISALLVYWRQLVHYRITATDK